MALRQIRIGSLPDVFQYDDADFNSAINTDHYIKTTQAPAAAEDVLRLGDLPSGSADMAWASANIGDNKAVRGDGGTRKVQDSDVDIKDGGDVSIPTGKGYQVNDIQVVTDQQAAESDASAVSAISLGAGADTVDRTTFNTDLTTLVTEINAIRTTLNNLLAKLRTHGLIDT